MTPFPFALVFPQDAHERLLIERLDALGVKVERRTELVRFEQHADGVRATLKRPDGAEEICEAAYLAGCDGARSTVREALAIGFPGGTYSGLFYVADVEATGPATNGEMHVDLDEADFLAVFPLKGKGRVRLVGTVRRASRPANTASLTFDDVQRSRDRASEAHDRQGELVLDLSRASPGGGEIPGGTRVPARRRRPHPQPGRRPGDEHRHRRRREPGVEARRRAERRRRRQPARHLRAGADRLRAPAGRHDRSRVHPGDGARARSPGSSAPGSFPCSRPCCFDWPPCAASCSGPCRRSASTIATAR